MPKTDVITQERLKELLHYNPLTGLFTWKIYRNRSARAGDVAGGITTSGYINIGIDNTLYRAHRLAFLYMLGWMPIEVDHDDQIKDNNRWVNLNPATSLINNRNKPLLKTNTSGFCGVYRNKARGKWRAVIEVEMEVICLGSFADKSDAVAARKAADIKYGFHDNHGKQSGIEIS